MKDRAFSVYLLIAISFLVRHQAFATVSDSHDYVQQGLAFYDNGQYNEAMSAFIRGLEVAEASNERRSMAVCQGYISNIYNKLGDVNRCYYYEQKAYDMALVLGDTLLQSSLLSNMVATLCRRGEIDKAKAMYAREQQLTPPDTARNRYYLIYNSARIAKAEHRLDESLRLHREAADYALCYLDDESYVLYQLGEMADVELQRGHPLEADSICRQCLLLAQQLNDAEMVAYAYSELAETALLVGDSVLAAQWRAKYLELSDSLFSINLFFNANGKLLDFENEQADRHISRLNTKISRQWLMIVVFSVLLLSLLVLTVVLVRVNRRLANAHRLLVSKNRDLMDTEERSKRLRAQISQQPELQQHIVEALDDQTVIVNPDFNLNMLAEMVGSNIKYVSQIINDTYGKSFKTLLNERRIQIACKLLTDTDNYGNQTIQAIYESSGYTNAASFIRAFKKVNGMTPSEYQKASCLSNASSD